ncbi:MAG TPA: bifunctional heptose 7-phosphate kinase/heptose 1-phosphate adenyltransferase, partial [Hyphomonadaceae bacterium]|nr:bifunctional heptose 7-phosphate kinase/heptose 1-phosphate adenyltransferase [Hyphomonadaceae bacterium]
MLDRFVYGGVSRVSPEAPIPVLEQRTVTSMLGAVGNVARNVASLGARAVVCSVTGADSEAEELLKLLSETDGLVGCTVQDSSRHTT